MKDLVITGTACWDSLGYDVSTNFQKILDTLDPAPTKNFFRTVNGFGLADPPDDIEEFRAQKFHKIPVGWFNLAGAWTVGQATAKSGLVQDRTRLGALAVTAFGDTESQLKTFQNYTQGRTRTVPGDFFYTTHDNLVGSISRIYSVGGTSINMAASCTAGLFALEVACALIQQDQLDQVIIIAEEICTIEYNAYRTNGLGVFSKTNRCRPFDRDRDGIIFGDAIAAIIVESRESALQRQAPIMANILGIGTSTQHLHRTNPLGATECYYDAFRKAIKYNNTDPKLISWISGHATGTTDGDIAESDVMQDLLPGLPITSFKGHIGHSMSACGISELVYTVESAQRKIIPRIGNFNGSDIQTNLQFVEKNMPTTGSVVIKNNYGFGGRAASVILQVE